MGKIILPGTLAGTARAADFMALLNAIQAAGNLLSDENVGPDGIREVRRNTGQGVILWNTSTGHNHDGVNSREIAAPTLERRGGVRYGIFSGSVAGAVSVGTWSSEVLAGSFDAIMGAWLLRSTAVAPGADIYAEHLEALPGGYGGAAVDLFSNRAIYGDAGDPRQWGAFVALDLQSDPPRAWVFNESDVAITYLLMVLGY